MATRKIGVKQVRGPYLELPTHENHCTTVDELKRYCAGRTAKGKLLAADLFCGAGGLSLGLTDAGIEVVFGIDHDNYAVQTHSGQFPGMSADWDLSQVESVERVAEVMTECGITVLAGGPPCQAFSKAGRSGIRHLVEQGRRDPHDARRDLWRSYLEVVTLARPKAVIMENVPDMALDSEMFIIRSMIAELESMGYSVETKVLDTWRYGVPQFRQRLILVALADSVKFTWPEQQKKKVSVWNAIGDLPEVEGGWRPDGGAHGWIGYTGPVTSFQKKMRRRVPDGEHHKLFDHITRPVREDDRRAFEIMTPETRYSDLPEDLKRYREDIFADKYKRLDENDLSRTITAHIAKDGYGYIHPRQPRTLTVREAARLQTFPDHFRFAGPPSAAFRQIGNAVPPRLGEALGTAVRKSLQAGEIKKGTAREVSEYLSGWYRSVPESELSQPWLRSGSRWRAAVGELLLAQASPKVAAMVWGALTQLPDVAEGETVPEETKDTLLFLTDTPNFDRRRQLLEQLCAEMEADPKALFASKIDEKKITVFNDVSRTLVELAAPVEADDGSLLGEPVITARGILRVTSCYQKIDAESRNKQTEGRLSIARMIGMSRFSKDAELAMFEIAQSRCTPEDPRCGICGEMGHGECTGTAA